MRIFLLPFAAFDISSCSDGKHFHFFSLNNFRPFRRMYGEPGPLDGN